MNRPVISILETEFPSHDFELIEFIDEYPSSRYVFWKSKGEDKNKILVKVYKGRTSETVLNEFYYQDLFFQYTSENYEAMCPEPIMVDEDNTLLVMDYIDGNTLKSQLLSPFSLEQQELKLVMDRSALALAHFHAMLQESTDLCYEHNLQFCNEYVCIGDGEFTRNDLEAINVPGLCRISNSFIDFSPPNIIIKGPSVHLVDFPNKGILSTPHSDLARFIFYLHLLKQHPFYKLLRLNWWEVEDLSQYFVDRYCTHINLDYNESDKYIIGKLINKYKNELYGYYRQESGLIKRIKGFYLSLFFKSTLDLGGK